MTTTFSTNDNNDIYLGADRNLVMNTGLLAVKDACANAAKTQMGEMLLYANDGIPNFTAVWIGNPNILQFEFFLRKTLLSVADVVEITDLVINADSGVLNYKATILTIYGLSEINGTSNGGI